MAQNRDIQHVVFGPDGNRRYADREGITFAESYNRLARKLVDIVEWTFEDHPVKELTLWLLQWYNLKREPEEASALAQMVLDHATYLCQSEVAQQLDLDVKAVGELDLLDEVKPGSREMLEDILANLGTSNKATRRVNLLVAYNADNELKRALTACRMEGVEPTFEALAEYWCIPPVTLFIRTGQPDGFNNLSSYWPAIERGRLTSTPTYPQDFSREEYATIISNFLNLKDSVKKVRAVHSTQNS